jgi:hypothetical protein
MKKIICIPSTNDPDESEAGLIHYDASRLSGALTLCGHTDRVGWDTEQTDKRVNCRLCMSIRDHVLGRTGRADHRQGKEG